MIAEQQNQGKECPDEPGPSSSCSSATRHRFQDLPYDVLLRCAEFMSVREVLSLGTINCFFHAFTTSENIVLWRHFTERVYLQHPYTLRQTLFNDSLLRMYAAINSIPVPLSSARAGVSDEYDVLNTAAISSQVISQEKLYQWVTDRCEEVIQDLRLFADIVENADSRFALTGLLVALQAVKKRMWCTEVADLESVRDLLRATVVEEEHDQGWVVLQTIANRTIPRRFLTSFTARMQSDNIESLNGKYKLLKRCWQRAAAVAREYMQLREVLRVVLAVSEVADHPNAQQRYDSVWSALCGTTAMLNAEKRRRCSESGDLDEVGAVIPMSATDDALLRQIRNLDKVTIGDIVSYFFGYVNGKVQRKTFLAALFSMKHLAGAEGYESVPFW